MIYSIDYKRANTEDANGRGLVSSLVKIGTVYEEKHIKGQEGIKISKTIEGEKKYYLLSPKDFLYLLYELLKGHNSDAGRIFSYLYQQIPESVLTGWEEFTLRNPSNWHVNPPLFIKKAWSFSRAGITYSNGVMSKTTFEIVKQGREYYIEPFAFPYPVYYGNEDYSFSFDGYKGKFMLDIGQSSGLPIKVEIGRKIIWNKRRNMKRGEFKPFNVSDGQEITIEVPGKFPGSPGKKMVLIYNNGHVSFKEPFKLEPSETLILLNDIGKEFIKLQVVKSMVSLNLLSEGTAKVSYRPLGEEPFSGPAKGSVNTDKAMTAPGGIDLNVSNGMQWKVSKDGAGVEMNITPALIERTKREGVNSLSPVIFRITPIASVWPLVGLEAPVKNS